jgi:ribonuclease D
VNTPSPTTPYLWVDNPATLTEALTPLNAEQALAVDTEADSLHHYRESLCLVQISQNHQHFLVDPLAEYDLSPLWQHFSKSLIILHGADYDLRLLRRAGAPPPRDVFDTQLAAQLVGHSAFGYAALVNHYFGETLCKASQTEDWSQRPLPEKMLDYAVQDTRYLEAMREKLLAELTALGRVEWHRQSCQRVMRSSLVDRPDDPDNDWQITGAMHLSGPARAILKSLWHWREAEAERSDLPPFKIMVNEKLVGLADWTEHHHFQSSLPPAFRWRYPRPDREKRVLAAMTEGKAAEPIPPPPKGKRPPREPQFDIRFEKFKARRDQQAKELKLDPSFLAAKSTLIEISRDPAHADHLIAQDRWCQWQWDLLKDALT